MSKLIRKLFPVNIYDIAGTESYLSDMAAKGLFFKKLAIFACFEKATPKKAAYRLEPLIQAEGVPTTEMLEHYERYGWHYVCTVKQIFHVYMTVDDEVTEIHTDPITQGYTYEHLNKKLKHSAISVAVLMTLAIGMILAALFLNGESVLYAVKYGQSLNQLCLAMLCVFVIQQSIRDSITIKRLLKSLQLGVSITHKKIYKRTCTYSYVVFASIAVISIGMGISSICGIFADWDMNLLDYNGMLPTVGLSEIENNENLKIDRYLAYNGKDYNSHISYDWSNLATAQYEITERGVVDGVNWADNSGTYSPSIKTEYYDLTLPFLVKPMLKELINKELEFYRYKPILIEELPETPFDSAVFIHVQETQMLFATMGDKVIYVSYHGYADLYSKISIIADAVITYNK